MNTKLSKSLFLILLCGLVTSCMTNNEQQPAKLPSLAYSGWVKNQDNNARLAKQNSFMNSQMQDISMNSAVRAQLKVVNDAWEDVPTVSYVKGDVVTNDNSSTYIPEGNPSVMPYQGALAYGNPGRSSSLWEERGSDLWRDDRAWQPMDLITIIVTESAEGAKEGDTEIKGNSSVAATIGEWLGIVDHVKRKNPNISDENGNFISASTKNNYKGEGETTRKDTLKAKISAMVVEVLPGNILRVEGEKIIALNQEEQTISISGLVRPKDINSNNEVDSAKIANLRIDYYGRGVVAEAQYGGWFTRVMRLLWPF